MMERRTGLLAVWLLVLASYLAPFSAASVDPNIYNTKVDRKLDLATQTVRISSTIKFENRGTKPVRSYLLALAPSDAAHLAFIGATQGKGRSQTPLAVEAVANIPGVPSTLSLYEVALARPVGGGESATIEVLSVHTGAEVPYPAEISQSEEQLVLYEGSVHLVSPYATASQSSKVVLPTSLVKGYTKAEPVKKSGTEITYGPFTDVAPLTTEELRIHFENNSPFAVADLEREIEVSHWGNVYVTENYKMRNAGAKHKGTFSRFEYQARPGMSGQNAIRELLARLPPRAHSIYYRDEIGNISTSHVRSASRVTEVQLEPRYPLMGGWKTEFTLGYSLPLADFLFRAKDGRRVLNITFGCPLRDVVVEDLTVKVILPEGSTELAASVPFPVAQSREVRRTYLDTVGRPVLVLHKSTAVMEHNQHCQVSYHFRAVALLAEPLLLVAFFGVLFATTMACMRVDLTIAKSSAAYQADLHRHKVRDILARLAALLTARVAEADKIEGVLKELSRSGDVAAARTARKAVEGSLKDSAKSLKALQDELDAAGDAKAAAKAAAVVAKEQQKVAAQAQLAETAVAVWEKKLAAKDGEQRMTALHARIKALKQEVRDAIQALED